MPTRYPHAARRFQADTAEHLMTVLHDDGLYRHIRFRRPDTVIGWYEIVTWPGALTINGDMGSFTFARLRDMTEFFTGSDINPGYWAEKVQGDRRSEIWNYDPDRMTQHITEDFRDYADTHGWPLTEVRDLWTEITDKILDSWEFTIEDERAVRDALTHFRWLPTQGREDLNLLPGFQFYDTWEWDTRDFTHRFLWCCFAVWRGVNRYRAAKGTALALPPLSIAVDFESTRTRPRPRRDTVTVHPQGGIL